MANEDILAPEIHKIAAKPLPTDQELEGMTRSYTLLDALREGSQELDQVHGSYGSCGRGCIQTMMWTAATARGQINNGS